MPTLEDALAAVREVRERAAQAKPSRDAKREFYQSQPWRRLRYSALRANRERHGTITCEVCGSRAGPFDCDHIVPLSRDWARRLDPRNVQIACRACNFGKSNRDSIDWREPASAVEAQPTAPAQAEEETR